MAGNNFSPPGSSAYTSDTIHVGDGTWDSERNTFLLPNLFPLNFETTRYNGMGNRFRDVPLYHRLIAAHGAIAAITFLGLIPIAIFIVRFGDHHSRAGNTRTTAVRWHIWLQILTLLLSTVVLVLGCVSVGSARSLSNPHHAIGVALYVLIVFQFFAGAFLHHVRRWMSYRELQVASLRKMLHQWIGRATAILGFAQIPLGLALYGSPQVYYILYALVMAIYVVVYFGLSYRAINKETWVQNEARRYGHHDGRYPSGHRPPSHHEASQEEEDKEGWGCGTSILALIIAYIGLKHWRKKNKKSETDSDPSETDSHNGPSTNSSDLTHSSDYISPSWDRARTARIAPPDYDRRRDRSYSPSRSDSRVSASRLALPYPESSHQMSVDTLDRAEKAKPVGKVVAGTALGAGMIYGIKQLFSKKDKPARAALSEKPSTKSPHRGRPRNEFESTTDLRRTDGVVYSHPTDQEIRRAEEGRQPGGRTPSGQANSRHPHSRHHSPSPASTVSPPIVPPDVPQPGLFSKALRFFKGPKVQEIPQQTKPRTSVPPPEHPDQIRASRRSSRARPRSVSPRRQYHQDAGDLSDDQTDSNPSSALTPSIPLSMPVPRDTRHHSDLNSRTPPVIHPPKTNRPTVRVRVGGGDDDDTLQRPSHRDDPPAQSRPNRRSRRGSESRDITRDDDSLLDELSPGHESQARYRRHEERVPDGGVGSRRRDSIVADRQTRRPGRDPNRNQPSSSGNERVGSRPTTRPPSGRNLFESTAGNAAPMSDITDRTETDSYSPPPNLNPAELGISASARPPTDERRHSNQPSAQPTQGSSGRHHDRDPRVRQQESPFGSGQPPVQNQPTDRLFDMSPPKDELFDESDGSDVTPRAPEYPPPAHDAHQTPPPLARSNNHLPAGVYSHLSAGAFMSPGSSAMNHTTTDASSRRTRGAERRRERNQNPPPEKNQPYP